MDLEPDYRQIEKVLHKQQLERLPIYKHRIDKPFIEKVLGPEISLQGTKHADYEE